MIRIPVDMKITEYVEDRMAIGNHGEKSFGAKERDETGFSVACKTQADDSTGSRSLTLEGHV